MNDPSIAPPDWVVRDATAFARGRALLRYTDALLFTVDEPAEGARLPASSLLLSSAVEALTAAVDPAFDGPCAEHAFWAALPSAQWGALFSKLERPGLSQASVLALRSLAWAGVARLEAPELTRRRETFIRWFKRLGVVMAVCAMVGVGVSLVRSAAQAPGLLAAKPFRTSSKLGRSSGSDKLLFHTEFEPSPWVEYDLQQRTQLHEVAVTNRSDCCDERALPLAVEVGDDQMHWVEVARRVEPFSQVVLPFARVEARYLRLRVDKASYLHLEAVGAR